MTIIDVYKRQGLTPVDASVIIADGEDGKTIGVQLSKEAGNTIVLKTDGLFAAGTQAPEFAIEKQGEATCLLYTSRCV